jgi:hypothetical protein
MSSNLNIPGPQFGLNELIDAFTVSVIEKGNEKKYNPIRPSAAGKCTKELGFEMMEFRGLASYEKEQKTASVHRLLNFGHQVERHVLDEMYKAFAQSPEPISIKYKQQVLSFFRLPDGTMLEGSLDLCIETKDWKMVCDIKSKGDKYSQFYKSSWEEFVGKLVDTGFATKFGEDAVYITDLEQFLDSGFDPFFCNNLYQLNFYACNPFLQERGINLAAVLQYNKNDSRLREIRFTPSQAVYDRIKDKFNKVVAAIPPITDPRGDYDYEAALEALPKDYVLGSSKCGFCSFRKQCWPSADALKEHFKTWPKKHWAKDFDRLPMDVQEKLKPLFDEYHTLSKTIGMQEKAEEKIVKILDDEKVYKVKLNKDQVYAVRQLKSGGKGSGERRVLRRDKE